MKRQSRVLATALAVLCASLAASPGAFGSSDTIGGKPPKGTSNVFDSNNKGTKVNGVISVEFRDVDDLVAHGGCIAAMRLRKGAVGPFTLVQELNEVLVIDDEIPIQNTTLAVIDAFKNDILEAFFELNCKFDDCDTPTVKPAMLFRLLFRINNRINTDFNPILY